MPRTFAGFVLPWLAALALLSPGKSFAGPPEGGVPELTNYQKAMRGLAKEEIRAGLASEKMLGMCIPTLRRTVGRFTEYDFELLPGYHGLTIIAKDGKLKRATEWSCTYTRSYFDKMTSDDEKQYRRTCKDNLDVPPERITEHWGWERPRMRDWGRDEAALLALQG